MLLPLTEATLFYLNVIFAPEPLKPSGTMKNWAASVASANPSKGSILASTRSASTGGNTLVESASGANINNHSSKAVDLVESDIEIHSWIAGFFEDEDEGEEQEAAHSSPIKGNQRLTSAVSISKSQFSQYFRCEFLF
jgi:hypothetical protein